jgi:hypothetical protein
MTRENTMCMNDFTNMAEAKSFALTLMSEGVQFTFCPQPISISFPMRARNTDLEDQVPSSG